MSEITKISIEDMNLHYGKFHALKNINMQIPEKEITAFIGPSGCGKSTLLKSLNRMNDLVEGCVITGNITLDGEDIYGDMDVNLLRKRVGMVFQKPNPFPMSIYDNIAYGPRTHGIRSKAKLDDIVEKIAQEAKDRLDAVGIKAQGLPARQAEQPPHAAAHLQEDILGPESHKVADLAQLCHPGDGHEQGAQLAGKAVQGQAQLPLAHHPAALQGADALVAADAFVPLVCPAEGFLLPFF